MNFQVLRVAAVDDHPVVLAGLQAVESFSIGELQLVHAVTEPV